MGIEFLLLAFCNYSGLQLQKIEIDGLFYFCINFYDGVTGNKRTREDIHKFFYVKVAEFVEFVSDSGIDASCTNQLLKECYITENLIVFKTCILTEETRRYIPEV